MDPLQVSQSKWLLEVATVSPFKGLTASEGLVLSLDLFRLSLTMHSISIKSLLLDSYENNVPLCSVLPDITCLFVNEMSQWGCLCSPSFLSPRRSHLLRQQLSLGDQFPVLALGVEVELKALLARRVCSRLGADPIPDKSWAAPLSTASKSSISEMSLPITAGPGSCGLCRPMLLPRVIM